MQHQIKSNIERKKISAKDEFKVIDPLELSPARDCLTRSLTSTQLKGTRMGYSTLPVCGKTSYGDRRGMSEEILRVEGTSCEDSEILSNTFPCHK